MKYEGKKNSRNDESFMNIFNLWYKEFFRLPVIQRFHKIDDFINLCLSQI